MNQNKIEKFISEYGHNPKKILDVYPLVESFEDLIYINRQFLKGNMCKTYYFYEYFGSPKTTSVDHAKNCINDLLLLNEKGIYSFDGQHALTEYEDGKNIGQQRSYLEFVCDRKTFKKIYSEIIKDKRIHISFLLPGKKKVGFWEDTNLTWYHNTEKDEKDECTNWFVEYFEDGCDTDFDNVDKILSREVYGMIFSKEFDDNQVDKILLEYL